MAERGLQIFGASPGQLAAKQSISEKNQANGYAGLDGSGKLLTAQFPLIALSDFNVVASQAAQLALTAEEGDIAVRSDTGRTYIHNGGTAGTIADWTILPIPTDAVTAVAGRTGAVVLTTADITDAGIITILAKTASYTPVVADASKEIAYNSASDLVHTLPQDTDQAHPVGSWHALRRKGTGALTVAAGTGATVLSPGGALTVAARYGRAVAIKSAANEWTVDGYLA